MDKKTVCSIQLFHNALDRLKEKHLTEDAWDQFVDEVETIIKEAVEG